MSDNYKNNDSSKSPSTTTNTLDNMLADYKEAYDRAKKKKSFDQLKGKMSKNPSQEKEVNKKVK